jgi:hypothetical protein
MLPARCRITLHRCLSSGPYLRQHSVFTRDRLGFTSACYDCPTTIGKTFDASLRPCADPADSGFGRSGSRFGALRSAVTPASLPDDIDDSAGPWREIEESRRLAISIVGHVQCSPGKRCAISILEHFRAIRRRSASHLCFMCQRIESADIQIYSRRARVQIQYRTNCGNVSARPVRERGARE